MTDTSRNDAPQNAAPPPLHWPEEEAPPAPPAPPSREPMTRWQRWVAFAGVVLVLVGLYEFMEGLVGILNPGYYVAASRLPVHLSQQAWGWAHLVLGVVAVVAGLGVFAGNTLARVVGVVVALLSAVVNLAWLRSYPAWGVVVIALDVIVIYALTVHGRELADRSR